MRKLALLGYAILGMCAGYPNFPPNPSDHPDWHTVDKFVNEANTDISSLYYNMF